MCLSILLAALFWNLVLPFFLPFCSGLGGFGTLRCPRCSRTPKDRSLSSTTYTICNHLPAEDSQSFERTRYINKYRNTPVSLPSILSIFRGRFCFLVIVQKVSRQSSEGDLFLFGCAMDLTDVPLYGEIKSCGVRLRTHLCFPRFPPCPVLLSFVCIYEAMISSGVL